MKDLTEHVKRKARRTRLFWALFPIAAALGLTSFAIAVLELVGG